MSTTVFDSTLFRDMFGTAEMRAVFSDQALIERYIEVEVALAKAEARCGVIPVEAAAKIAELSRYASLDLALMQHETEIVGYPILPLVEQLSAVWRSWPLRALGRHHPGHHGHRRGPAGTRRAGHRRARRAGRAWPAGGAGAALPRHADGRPYPPAARAADHLRLQVRGVAEHVRPPCRAPGRVASSGRSRAVRWRRRYPGFIG